MSTTGIPTPRRVRSSPPQDGRSLESVRLARSRAPAGPGTCGGPGGPPRGGLALALAAILAAPPLLAQTANAPLTGSVSLGLRSVDVGGATSKFREDVNLDDGVRLLDATLSYAPAPGENALVDRLDLDASNLGGDPFETVHFSARKFGAYELKLDHRRSDYFYQDVILPRALASVTASTAGDHHEFDFERVQDSAKLDINLTPTTELRFGLDRFARRGESTTTLDVQRDEFELDRPIDESLESFSVGVEHAFDKVTLVFERQDRDFENASELFLPGASAGENTTDAAELQFFTLDQSYDYSSSGQVFRVIATPTARLDLKAAWRNENLDLDADPAERSAGTDFNGLPFATDLAGAAHIRRDIELGQIDLGYGVSGRLRVIGSVRRSTLEQRGTLVFGGDAGAGFWDIETTGAEAGFEIAASARVVVTAGLSAESRDLSAASMLAGTALGGTGATERDGFFARLAYHPAAGTEISASVEDDDIDDPATLASPTSTRRYRVHGRHRWNNGLALSGTIRHDARDNALSGWTGETDQSNLRLSYDGSRLRYAFGYTLIELDRSIDQLVAAGTRQDLWLIDYVADATLLDGSVHWRLNDRIGLGGSFNFYENDGSFALERDDLRAYVDIGLGQQYSVRVGLRDLDYSEDRFDDYDATLLEVALGLRW